MKALVLAMLLASPALAQEYSVKGTAEFKAEANPGFLKINGTGGKVTGTAVKGDQGLTGVFKVRVSDFTTGMTLRDEHMQDKYMEKAKCPEITLELDPHHSGASEFTGKLTFHCVTKPIKGKASLSDNKVKAEFDVIPSHFGVNDVNWAGVGMEDKITALVEIELVAK